MSMKRIIIACMIGILIVHGAFSQPTIDSLFKGGELLLDYEETGYIYIYSENEREIVDSIHHDFARENFICFHVLDSCSRDSFLLVQPYWSLGETNATQPGWIKLSGNIVIGLHYSKDIPLYRSPSFQSPYKEVAFRPFRVPVYSYYRGWVYVKIPPYTGNTVGWESFEISQEDWAEAAEGWISPRYQCANVYTTCN